MKHKRRIIGIVAATLLAVIGTVSLVRYVQSAKNEAVAQEALVDVYVVDAFVPKGADPATIRSSVSIEQVPARLKQAGAITTLDDVGEMVAASDLQPGDQLLAARLVDKELVADEVTDKVQVSTLLAAERAVGGNLHKGALVGVYVSFTPFEIDEAGQPDEPTTAAAAAFAEASTQDPTQGESAQDAPTDSRKKTPNVTRLEFQHVLVTNVQTINAPVSSNADDDDDPGIAQVTGTQYVVTLALSPEESERFVFATEFGRVWLSIQPATAADDGTRPVTLGDVYRVVQ